MRALLPKPTEADGLQAWGIRIGLCTAAPKPGSSTKAKASRLLHAPLPPVAQPESSVGISWDTASTPN